VEWMLQVQERRDRDGRTAKGALGPEEGTREEPSITDAIPRESRIFLFFRSRQT
jgi:hypothetical protein